MFTRQDVLDYVEQEDVSFIRLAFCDIYGKQKNVSVPATELERAFDTGISFDASAVSGFGGEVKSDLFLFPDPSTLSVLPWRPSHGRVVRMYCDIKYPDGSPFEMDGRYILRCAEKAAGEKGIICNIGAEFEFYLFKTDENGEPTRIPHDCATYMDVAPEDKGENIRREICMSLSEMGIFPETSHHEEGPGQHEIDFKYSDAFTAADNAITFKGAVTNIAAQNGLYACFEPKPLDDESGNGMHINISPASHSGEDFTDEFMAGLMAHIKDITLFLNPTRESYKRFGALKAPRYISWSPENRSQLIRIPAAHGDRQRIELRSPDAQANPYIAYALLIYAGLDGIERNLSACEPANIDLFRATAKQLENFDRLPDSLEEAAAIAKSSEFVRKHLPGKVIERYSERC